MSLWVISDEQIEKIYQRGYFEGAEGCIYAAPNGESSCICEFVAVQAVDESNLIGREPDEIKR